MLTWYVCIESIAHNCTVLDASVLVCPSLIHFIVVCVYRYGIEKYMYSQGVKVVCRFSDMMNLNDRNFVVNER